MKRIGIISTAALALLLGIAASGYAEQEKQGEKQREPEKQAEPTKQAKPEQQHVQQQKQAKPEQQHAQQQKQTQPAKQAKPEQHVQKQKQAKPEQQHAQQQKQQDQNKQQQQHARQQKQQNQNRQQQQHAQQQRAMTIPSARGSSMSSIAPGSSIAHGVGSPITAPGNNAAATTVTAFQTTDSVDTLAGAWVPNSRPALSGCQRVSPLPIQRLLVQSH